jgi:hypothetical protein
MIYNIIINLWGIYLNNEIFIILFLVLNLKPYGKNNLFITFLFFSLPNHVKIKVLRSRMPNVLA